MEALVNAERRGEEVAPVDDLDWEDIFYIHDGCQWPSDPPAFKETIREYTFYNPLQKDTHFILTTS